MKVHLDTAVFLANLHGETFWVTIAREADPLNRVISPEAPLGRALLGQEVGREVMVLTPKGTVTYLVLDVVEARQQAA